MMNAPRQSEVIGNKECSSIVSSNKTTVRSIFPKGFLQHLKDNNALGNAQKKSKVGKFSLMISERISGSEYLSRWINRLTYPGLSKTEIQMKEEQMCEVLQKIREKDGQVFYSFDDYDNNNDNTSIDED